MSADHANISPEQWRELLDHRDTSLLEVALHQQPELVKTKITGCDHPHGAMPLSYIAMQRFDTVAMRWRNVERTGPVAQLLIDAGASIEGVDGDRETPLITAASYGDAEVAAVLISAGADLDAISAHNSGGVPSSTLFNTLRCSA